MTDLRYEFLVTGYVRAVSLSLMIYEFLSTLPLAWQIYSDYWTKRRPRMPLVSIILLFLLRVTSVLHVIFAAFVFFHQTFTQESCAHFYILAPTFRAMQTSVSQAILGLRAINLSTRANYVTYTLIAVYLMVCPIQWVTTLFGRKPTLGTYWLNCRAAVVSPFLGVWMGYALAMAYDLLASGICLWYLYRWKGEMPLMSNFFTIMIGHGLGYYFILTGMNILNTVIFYQNSEYEATYAPLGCCITFILSQKLLTHVYTCRSYDGCRADTSIFSRDALNTNQFVGIRSNNTMPDMT